MFPTHSSFRLLMPGKCLVFPLIHFVIGIRLVKFQLSELHPTTVSTINKTFVLLLLALKILYKKERSLTVVYHPHTKKTTSSDNVISSDSISLPSTWFQMLVPVLIGSEKDFVPFWNNQSKGISQRLWLPTEIDFVGSPSNSLSLSLPKQTLNSLSWTMKHTNPTPKSYPTIYSPSSMSIPVEKWGKGGIRTRTRKIRLYPTKNQKQIMKRWLGTTRYVYNQGLNYINDNPKNKRISFQSLRNQFVTSKPSIKLKGTKDEDVEGPIWNPSQNTTIKAWELETPKDIRAGALKDLTEARKRCFEKMASKQIKFFKLKFRCKKQDNSIVIPKRTISFQTNKKTTHVSIYSTYMSPIKCSKDRFLKSNHNYIATHDCRLKLIRSQWFLHIPVDCKRDKHRPPNTVCSLDPGLRKFQTIYSQEEVTCIGINKEYVEKIQSKQDRIQSLRDKKQITRHSYDQKRKRYQTNYSNQVDDMHYKLISELTRKYKTILLPRFESQKVMKKMKGHKNRRLLLGLQHYTFRKRFQDKTQTMKYSQVYFCTEEYTSKTCGNCGVLKYNLGISEIYKCGECQMRLDRDINGARNILIKVLTENK